MSGLDQSDLPLVSRTSSYGEEYFFLLMGHTDDAWGQFVHSCLLFILLLSSLSLPLLGCQNMLSCWWNRKRSRMSALNLYWPEKRF